MARDGSWSDRWNRLKNDLTLKDLLLDVSAKTLVALGLGAILAAYLERYAVALIIGGLVLSATVKAKYWKRFWAHE